MRHLLFLLISMLAVTSSAVYAGDKTAADKWGTTPRLSVVGNHLEDPEGNQVMLHGVMDTPSPYFCGYRFTGGHWIDVYREGDNYIDDCKIYFNKLFTAITDTAQGSWCNVFRLHMDPCWTNDSSIPSTGSETGEANISQFSETRLRNYLAKLFLPLAKLANGHGLYVIMRPPGVCPNTIKVGDAYHKYLLKVWDNVSRSGVARGYSNWLSLELANEPIRILDANGQESDHAMYDFFQPIVDKIRANGFDGIIWIPGGTWQQNYRPYAAYPIQGDNIGYAVHFYPGWYSTSDSYHDATASIRAFANSVPVVKTSPIMITEVDWSPENPNGNGHYNESGQWVMPNYGTWATGSTSKFGEAYRAVLDYFGNIGMNLTHTHDYMDIDRYLADGYLQPAFTGVMPDTYEACSGACFQWYKEYAHRVPESRVWETDPSCSMFPLDEFSFNPSIWETGVYNPATGYLKTGKYGFGGWQFSPALDLSAYNYLVVKLRQEAPDEGGWGASFRLFDQNNYWSDPAAYSLEKKSSIAIDLRTMKTDKGVKVDPRHIYIAGFWTMGNQPIYIESLFVSDDGISPSSLGQPAILQQATELWTLDGLPAKADSRGFIIERLTDGTCRKIIRR